MPSGHSGVSMNLVSTAIQLSVETHSALTVFSRKNVTINGLSKSVNALGEAFGRLEKKDLDLLKEREGERLGEITKTSINSLNAILPILNSALRKGTVWRLQLGISRRFISLMAEKRQAMTSSLSLLNLLLLKVEGRRGTTVTQLSQIVSDTPPGARRRLSPSRERTTVSQTCHVRSYRLSSRALDLQACRAYPSYSYSSRRATLWSQFGFDLWLPRGCILIMLFFATFVALSCFLGVYFTVEKSYGYSMGDAFTLAGWVMAVGAFISSAILAYHRPRCKCWEASKYRELSRLDGYELQTLVELPG